MTDLPIVAGTLGLLAIITWQARELCARDVTIRRVVAQRDAVMRDLRLEGNARTRRLRVPVTERAPAPTPAELARVVCPLFERPRSVRHLVRSRAAITSEITLPALPGAA